MTLSNANNSYDAIVIGAGIVGQSMALGLAKQGFQIALIDHSPLPSAKQASNNAFSARVSAISLASRDLLVDIGAWDLIGRKQCYSKMHVWDKDGFGDIMFDAKEISGSSFVDNALQEVETENCLGHIIENDQLNFALHQALERLDNATCFYEAQIASLQTNQACAQVVLANNQIIEGKLLIGADGANSKVRESFGFKHTFWDYDHQAIVANVTTELPHNNCAKQAFTPFGPLAFLPLPDKHQSSIVFSQQSEQAVKLMALSNADFEKELLVAIDSHYGKVELNTARQSFPLRMRYARQWTGTRVALIGDAAHTIHPLAGQGANLGLADVASLLAFIARSPEHIGRSKELRQYERKQKSEALKVIATMESFKQLFDGNQPLKKWLRNIGLVGANKLPLIKRFFIQQAMGK